jgi:acetylornithine deacetylase/succinyl-diaminopimelate desuccinylase-like protein
MAPMSTSLNPKRTVAELKELRALTGDDNGAQRVAFTETWLKARGWLRQKVVGLPLEIHNDAAGNTWFTLRGESEKALLIGGHIDSVPNGGWLDGCLNVLAGIEILRRINAQYNGKPPITVRVVDWADEEGARFGKSLFGSSACSGNLDMNEARGLVDKSGIKLPEALKSVGIDFERVKDSGVELKDAAAYLELHIEQGPVLLDLDLPLGAVLGTFGVERHAITFHGQAAHSGSTPMNRRKDAFLAAARMSPEVYQIAARSSGTGILPVRSDSTKNIGAENAQAGRPCHYGGVCTIGSCTTKPGIVTSVVEECRITLDQRHLDASALAKMLHEAKAASEKFAREGNVKVTWERLWQIAPRPFNDELIAFCGDAIRETCGESHRLPSGPLHDAAEVAFAGVPTVMMFVQSLHGISHNKIEDTKEEHLEMCVTAFDKLAEKTIGWIQKS